VGNLVNQHVRFIESGEFLTYPKPTGGNSLDRLIERKQMSTKTTFKRVALVAVTSLGFGLLSVIASPSASATPREATAITVGTVPTCRVLTTCTVPVTFNLPAATVVGTDSFTVVAKVTSAPAASNSYGSAASGSVAAVTSAVATASDLDWANATSGSGSLGSVSAGTFNAAAATSTGNWAHAASYTTHSTDLAGQVTLNLTFRADVAGSYNLLLAAVPVTVTNETAASTSSIATLAGYTATSVTITTGASPATVTLTNLGGTAATSVTGSSGALLKISGAVLAGAESITLTGSTSTIGFSDSVLTASEFTNGVAYVNVTNSAAQTASVTATASGTLSGLTSSAIAITWEAPSTQAAPTLGFNALDTTLATGGTISGADNTKLVSTTRTTQTVRVTLASQEDATTDFVTFVNINDISGKITGKAGALWSKSVTIAAGDTYADVTVTATLLDGQEWVATLYTTATASDGAGTEGATRNATTAAIYPSIGGVRSSSTLTAITAAPASTSTYFTRITDQFGGGMAGRSVTVTLVGRNAAVSSTLVTDASGYASYSITDAGTSGTTDTLTFTDGSATKALTITYGTTTVTTMTLTGGNTTAGVTSSTKTAKDIAAGTAGAAAGVQTITATLKDANGALMNGIPVTWSVAGTTAAILSTQVTKYSGSTGTATTSVYAWTAGTYVVTATAGGVTATAEITFAQNSPEEARTLSATVSGQIVSAKLVDRFGNPVLGATVYASKVSGTGYFGGGVSKTNVVTGADGIAEFAIAGGDAEIKLSTISYAAAAGSKPADQTCARAGKVDCNDDAADDTAFTAATVGTASTAETGIGASFAPAGVSTVTVSVTGDTTSQAAADAAAEATDAANAATDAANAAAEAADAATAAAQDAADAVAALSTQVSEMVNALKKQITALTNLVIKIQKKVKA
jgi:trimeric autotransporter adhesin